MDVGLDHPVHVYKIAPKGGVPKNCPLIINFHGGGFIKGRQSKDQLFCSNLSEQLNALVWDIDPKQIILTGHSAGGNLAITVCMRAGETNAFRPAALIAEYCPLDIATDPSLKPGVDGDMPAEVAKTYNAFYCPRRKPKIPMYPPLVAKAKTNAAQGIQLTRISC